MDSSLPGTPVHGILQARFPRSPSGDLPDPEIEPVLLTSPALAGGFFTTSATWEALESDQYIVYIQYDQFN